MKKKQDKKKRRRYRDWSLPPMVFYSPLRSLFWDGESDTWTDLSEESPFELTLATAKICPLPEEEVVFMSLEKAQTMVSNGDFLNYQAYAHRVQPNSGG